MSDLILRSPTDLTIGGVQVPLIDTDAPLPDGKVLVKFSENNSGGHWWLNGEQYRALLMSGWGLDLAGMQYAAKDYARKDGAHYFDTDDVPYFLRSNVVSIFDSYAEGVAAWESATGASASTVGCECCGPPYQLYDW